jgi:DNA-binding transcriptional LysR family regulator
MLVYEQVYKFWLLSLLDSYKNFKDAANHARMTQSALSQNITSLESIYGKTLVIRGRGVIQLTETGRHLISQLRPILDSLQKIEGDDTPTKDRHFKTKIAIGTYESVAVNVLPRLLKKFGVLYPGIKLDLRTSRTDILSRLVRKGELDFALTINGESDKMIQSVDLATDELGLFVSTGYQLLNRNFETWEEWPLATVSTGPEGLPVYYERFLKSIPGNFHVVLNSDSFETIRSLTVEGSAVGLLPVRVAGRKGNDLIKIWPREEKISKQSRHHISLINRRSVNQELVQLFKTELMDCLNS